MVRGKNNIPKTIKNSLIFKKVKNDTKSQEANDIIKITEETAR